MAEIYTLDGDDSKTAEEAIAYAQELAWQDIVCIGYGENGELQVVSSHISNEVTLMLLEIVKAKIMAPFTNGEIL